MDIIESKNTSESEGTVFNDNNKIISTEDHQISNDTSISNEENTNNENLESPKIKNENIEDYTDYSALIYKHPGIEAQDINNYKLVKTTKDIKFGELLL